MSRVLVDTNVILDVATRDPVWSDWSRAQLRAARAEARLVINPIIFAEVSVGFSTIELAEAVVPLHTFVREELPWSAAFLAGKAYLAYRRRGGIRRSSLSDFFIGAHAAIAGYRLLTRDAARYRSSFPKLDLITPG